MWLVIHFINWSKSFFFSFFLHFSRTLVIVAVLTIFTFPKVILSTSTLAQISHPFTALLAISCTSAKTEPLSPVGGKLWILKHKAIAVIGLKMSVQNCKRTVSLKDACLTCGFAGKYVLLMQLLNFSTLISLAYFQTKSIFSSSPFIKRWNEIKTGHLVTF